MDKNFLIQSIIVGIILFATIIFIIHHYVFNKHKSSRSGCEGCALSRNCTKTETKGNNCK